MGYFNFTGVNCAYQSEWDAVVRQVRGWPSEYRDYRYPLPVEMSHHLEAKALYILTMARRLVRTACELGKANWELVFVETTSLLFPMIELVGHARLDARQARIAYGKGPNEVPSVANLWAGLHWLRDSANLPQVNDNRLKYDSDMLDRWQIGHLISLRNYYLHGSKSAKDRKGRLIPIADIMSYELPRVIVECAEKTMPEYWKQLKEDDGTQEWVARLASADIRPFKVQGSSVFEAGLVDPNIVDYLEGM
ncbi:MAG: hypothetical protein ACFFCP_19980 [Promethearchaeota archaeon]